MLHSKKGKEEKEENLSFGILSPQERGVRSLTFPQLIISSNISCK